jgi:D-ribulokinase
MNDLLFVGIDIGTGGVRAVALTKTGAIQASGHFNFSRDATRVSGMQVEQSPEIWSRGVVRALKELTSQLDGNTEIAGISVAATSGTFLLLDDHNHPITPGIMYSDLRAEKTVQTAQTALGPDLDRYGIKMGAGFALPKILHIAKTDPDLFARCCRIVHQTDWVVGLLTENFGITDISTALKTGADPGTLKWPDPITSELGIDRDVLPEIVLPGKPIGTVTPKAAELTGVAAGTPVIAGCTDGTAGCLASGSRLPGDMNVTLGTTLVFKGISTKPLIDPEGILYNHRHPAGGFLPGGASNTGGDWIGEHFPGADLDKLDSGTAELLPTGKKVFPLVKQGERFPFNNRSASGFGLKELGESALAFTAGMEGVAFLERMAFERFKELGYSMGKVVYATGGGTKSKTWMRIRASVANKTYCVPDHPESAVGAAVLAAMPEFGSCENAIEQLIHPDRKIEPEAALTAAYEEHYREFLEALRARGYF